MAKRSHHKLKAKQRSWIDGLVLGYLVVVVGIGAGLGGYYLSQVSGVLAETPGAGGAGNVVSNAPANNAAAGGTAGGSGDGADSTTSLTFEEYFCDVVAPIGGDVIASLTVLMLLAAGVVYILSLGQSSGDVGGISTAKAMITAAITGMMSYLMGTLLLGQCGFTPGGWIFSLFGGGSGGGPTVSNSTDVTNTTDGSSIVPGGVDIGGGGNGGIPIPL